MKSISIALFFAVSLSVSATELPNIVVFLSDDLGRLETSVYGSQEARTPTMERLAAEGMTFENAYVASPSCCPNRFSLLTGLMPARHGAHPNHSQPKPGTQFLLPILKEMGYYIASFGKVAHARNKMEGVDYRSPAPREMSTNVEKHFAETNVDQPICLLVGDRRPHVSWTTEKTYDPSQVHLPPYFIDTPETRDHWARYLSDITGMDEEMGRVYEFAQKRFGDDFIFLFTSDHGGQWHMGKWTLYDAGTRIPLIVRWPNHIDQGVRTNAMVSWVDLIPTLIDLAGGKPSRDIDGISFAPVLTGKTNDHRDKIFTTHTGDGAMNIFPIRSVRVGNLKYIHNLQPDAWFTNHSDRHRKDGAGAFWDSWDAAAESDPEAQAVLDAYYTRPEFQLFDLDKDPLELSNLADNPEYKNRLQEMQATLAAWAASQGDDLKPHKAPYPRSKPIPEITHPKKRPQQK